MWINGNQKPRKIELATNEDLLKLEGYLNDKEAKTSLYEFLRNNITFATSLLTGVNIFPFQHMMIKTFLDTDYSLAILSRGAGKSYVSGIYAVLEALFNPGINIGIFSKSFRQSRLIFQKIEDIANKPDAALLRQSIGKISKSSDLWRMDVGRSKIYSLPLGDGCLAKNSLLMTNNGIFSIEDLMPEHDIDISSQEFPIYESLKIRALNKFKECDQKFYNGIKKTIKIKTHLGYEIEATPNHKFKILNGDTGNLEWKELKDISCSDQMAMSCSQNWHLNETEVDEHEAYCTGLLIGDGHLYKASCIGYATTDGELIQALRNSNIMRSWTDTSDGRHYTGIGGDKMKLDFFERVGISEDHLKTIDKRFPSRILQSNKKVVAAFISGLFDTDGTLQIAARKGYDSCCVSFCNTSEILIKQLHQVLLYFGIKAHLSDRDRNHRNKNLHKVKWKHVYELKITGENVKRFYEQIGFRLSRKQNKLKEFCENKKRWFSIAKNDNVDIKNLILNEIEFGGAKLKDWKRDGNSICPRKIKRKKYITKSLLKKIIKGYGLENKFGHLIEEGLFFQKIKEKTESYCPTYDFHIPSDHEYVANGFCVHNSKLRGFRFNVVIIDEYLLMPESIVNEVILPFLSVPQNPDERQKLHAVETRLIEKGEMKEEDRYVWPNNKLIGLSSASYKFESLYKIYQSYDYAIKSENAASSKVSRAIVHMSYDCMPSELYDKNLIEQARLTLSQSQFDREFGALFTDDSSGYFKLSKMKNCCIPDGEKPTIEVKGEPGAEYILAFDPSWSQTESSDDFAIQILKVDKESKKSTLVHSYALSGEPLKVHIQYLLYCLDNFNIVAICGDYNGGVQFLQACNESDLFISRDLELKTIDTAFEDPEKYQQDLAEYKMKYNVSEKRIVILRKPSSRWIRQANELLQANFDHKRIFFGARAIDQSYKQQISKSIPIENLKFVKSDEATNNQDKAAKMVDLVENQFDMIAKTIDQCALIQITSTAQGTQTFDLPPNLRKQTGPGKARKDSYSALVLGNWMAKIYYDSNSEQIQEVTRTFVPQFVA